MKRSNDKQLKIELELLQKVCYNLTTMQSCSANVIAH